MKSALSTSSIIHFQSFAADASLVGANVLIPKEEEPSDDNDYRELKNPAVQSHKQTVSNLNLET